MSTQSASDSASVAVLSTTQLREQVTMIKDSGELGRSTVYADLLDFLAACAERETSPKEIEVAMAVLGKSTDFDVAKDSSVRVYVHQLRKKLDRYYAKHQPAVGVRLVIPKGQYTLGIENVSSVATPAAASAAKQWMLPIWMLAVVAILLLANLLYGFARDLSEPDSAHAQVLQSPLWQPLIKNDLPIVVVMGDFYIFGELDRAGNVYRMVREFDINSKADLETRFAEQPALAYQYYDLDLTYLPEASATALNALLPVLHSTGKPVQIKMMSMLTTEDLISNNLVYLGYVSAMNRLAGVVFAASGLEVGENYDELIQTANGTRYISDEGMAAPGSAFSDYGFIAGFPLTPQSHVLVVAGLRDAGLTEAARSLASPAHMAAITQSLSASAGNSNGALEALFEVRGIDRTNFSARLVYSQWLDVSALWDRSIVLEPSRR